MRFTSQKPRQKRDERSEEELHEATKGDESTELVSAGGKQNAF